jgi:hypothetical protein
VRCNNLAVARCLQLERYTALRQFYNNVTTTTAIATAADGRRAFFYTNHAHGTVSIYVVVSWVSMIQYQCRCLPSIVVARGVAHAHLQGAPRGGLSLPFSLSFFLSF